MVWSFFLFLVSKYTLIDNWYDPKSITLGQIGGIEVNQKTDTLVVFHRGSQIWQAEYDEFSLFYFLYMSKYLTFIRIKVRSILNIDSTIESTRLYHLIRL